MWEFFVPYCFSCYFHSLVPWSCTKLTVKRNRLVQRRFGDVPALCALARELLLASRRSDDDARPRGLPARPSAHGAATVALVFLLRALDLPIPKLPLVEVERCQGNEDDPHEHSHQHEECEGGGERRKDAELLHAGSVIGLENPVTAVQRHRQSRRLRGSGCHPVHLSRPLLSLWPQYPSCSPGSAWWHRPAHVVTCTEKTTHETRWLSSRGDCLSVTRPPTPHNWPKLH